MIKKLEVGDLIVENIRGKATMWRVDAFEICSGTSTKAVLINQGAGPIDRKKVNVRTLFNSKVWEHTRLGSRK